MREVREDLRRGIPDQEHESFRERVLSTVKLIDKLCAERGATPNDLPPPSRNAYRFLRDLDLGVLPAPRAGSERARRKLSVRNALGAGYELAARLWTGRGEILSDGVMAESFRSEARGHAEAIEAVCREQGGTPAEIPLPSRRMFCWFQFLGEVGNLLRHAAALERGGKAVLEVRPDLVDRFRIRLENFTPLWRARNDRHGAILRISEGFIDAPPEIWAALAAGATGAGTAENRHAVRGYGESEEFAEVLLDLDSRASPDAEATGVHHDLLASFDRVNSTYFGGRLSKPRLHWNESQTVRKFGHYLRSRDSVMVSIALDDPGVPEFVIDSVVHHELLHRVLGATIRDGRALIHSPEFRREERRFVRYDEAQAFLRKFAGALH